MSPPSMARDRTTTKVDGSEEPPRHRQVAGPINRNREGLRVIATLTQSFGPGDRRRRAQRWPPPGVDDEPRSERECRDRECHPAPKFARRHLEANPSSDM